MRLANYELVAMCGIAAASLVVGGCGEHLVDLGNGRGDASAGGSMGTGGNGAGGSSGAGTGGSTGTGGNGAGGSGTGGATGTGGRGTGGTSGSSGTGGDHDAAVLRDPACPSGVPVDGASCTALGVSCEYGGNSHHACTTMASCATDGTGPMRWFVSHPDPDCGSSPGCPSSFSARASGSACPVDAGSPTCDYPEGRCACLPCRSGDTVVSDGLWTCRAWNDIDPGCPAVRPLAGDACDTPGQSCGYAGCRVDLGAGLVCTAGFWRVLVNNGACTINACSNSDAGTDVDASDANACPSLDTFCPSSHFPFSCVRTWSPADLRATFCNPDANVSAGLLYLFPNCGGYNVAQILGVDTSQEYFYDPQTLQLVSIEAFGLVPRSACVAGLPIDPSTIPLQECRADGGLAGPCSPGSSTP